MDESGTPYIRVPLWQAPAKAIQDMGDMIVGTVNGIGQIIHGQIPWNKAVSGPVGIVNVTGQVAATVPQIGPYLILYLTAYLSLNLAFVNALPIPALDGGRVLLVGVEVLRRGKRLSPEREGLINLVGMGLLLLLMLVVTLNDVGNLFPQLSTLTSSPATPSCAQGRGDRVHTRYRRVVRDSGRPAQAGLAANARRRDANPQPASVPCQRYFSAIRGETSSDPISWNRVWRRHARICRSEGCGRA